MSCVLRVSGKQFAARPFAEGTALPVCAVFAQGEPRFSRSQPKGKKHLTSSVHILVSRASFTNSKRQIRDALKFLEVHRRELARLTRVPGVESITLDFGIADRNLAAQFEYFPPELLLATGKLGIGIEVSVYQVSATGA
jgi:hypothetical protein